VVEAETSRWIGVINEGALLDYELEVRRQQMPWPLYLLALRSPNCTEEPIITFAIGKDALTLKLAELRLNVTWSDGYGPLAPERDHPQHRYIREPKSAHEEGKQGRLPC